MKMSDNIVLTGFMATGKTSVGRLVAERLQRPFIDMDVAIEARAGKPIPRIFAEDGEAAFRETEARLCSELAEAEGLVIATGGGTLIDPENRQRMLAAGTVICLSGSPQEILQRVASAKHERPLLDVANPQQEIERILAARREAYAAIPWQIVTDERTVSEVADLVLALAHGVGLQVSYSGGRYPIQLGKGLLNQVGALLEMARIPQGSQVALVSNPIVAPLYAAAAEGALRTQGFLPFRCMIADGEAHKTLTTVASLYDQFLKANMGRGDTVLALGGGVTGDIAGFAAATFMRGVRFVQVPTTLLAMVDSSVGGKTGVDLPQGKNLVGAFKQPALVVIDPSVLATLAHEELRSGLAEVIKHGIIAAPDLFGALEEGTGDFSRWWGDEGPDWLTRALQVKIDIVREDPFEHGRRAVLNLGHTAGHAIERLSDFSLRHGEAVSIGLVVAAHIAAEMGRLERQTAKRIEAALTAWGLPVRCPPFEVGAIWRSMAHDKKRQGRALRWILPLEIGRVDIFDDVPREIVERTLCTLGAQGQVA